MPAATPTDILLAEYEELKAEQRERIKARDHLTYATLAAVAAAVAGAVQTRTHALLLGVPVVCAVLGWTRLTIDEKVSAIGRYLREDLGPRLATEAGAPVLGWETVHRGGTAHRRRKQAQLAADLATFVAPAAGGSLAALALPVHPLITVVVLLVGLGLAGALGYMIVAHADFGPTRQQPQLPG
jgi:hypothetical protein